MDSGFLAMLGRLWVLLIAFLRGTNLPSPSVLPVAVKVSGGKVLGSTRKTDGSEWKEQKEQFLRHPSLRSKEICRQLAHPGTAETRTDKWRKKDRSNAFVTPTFTIQDWSTLPAIDVKPPPRPPRPPSDPIPAVIVTPCAPTIPLGGTTPQSSPTGATVGNTSAKHLSPDSFTRSKHGRTDARLSANTKHTAKPTVDERETLELTSLSGSRNPFENPDATFPADSPPRPFILPEPTKAIDFKPAPYSSEAFPEMFWDAPSWVDPASTAERLNSRAASYITSTPSKRRKASFPEGCLHLPVEQADLLPYPDVFDLDLYYGIPAGRFSISRNAPSPSQVRQSLADTKPLLPLVRSQDRPKIGVSKAKRFGFIQEESIPRSPVSQVAMQYRDQYRPAAYSRTPLQRVDNTIMESSINTKPLSSPSHMSWVLVPFPPANPSEPASRALQTRIPGLSNRFTSSKRNRNLSPIKENVSPTPPIVIVSHHRFGSLSEDSQYSNSDSESLQACLRDTCDDFLKSVLTDDSYTLEGVSLL